MFSFFLSSFLPIIIYIYIIIKRIKQKGMIKNKICQLDNSYLKKTGIIQDNRHFLITYLKKSLTPSTKRVSHRGSLLKGVALHRVLYQSIFNAKLTEWKNLGRKRCTSNRDDRKLENSQAKLIQTLGRAS